ncbi:hypothetical protein ACA910_005613 [Epithemia clementina (nom. ined.)]
MGSMNRPLWIEASLSWSQQGGGASNNNNNNNNNSNNATNGDHQNNTKSQQSAGGGGDHRAAAPSTPPVLPRQCSTASSSGDDTPVSRFRKDAKARHSFRDSSGTGDGDGGDEEAADANPKSKRKSQTNNKKQPKKQLSTTPPCFSTATAPADEILKFRSVASRVGDEDAASRAENMRQLLQEEAGLVEGEDTTSLLFVEQGREAIFAVTEPECSRLSDESIQQILVAAMRYEKDHAPTVATRQPSTASMLLLPDLMMMMDSPAVVHVEPPSPSFMPHLLEPKPIMGDARAFLSDDDDVLNGEAFNSLALYAEMERLMTNPTIRHTTNDTNNMKDVSSLSLQSAAVQEPLMLKRTEPSFFGMDDSGMMMMDFMRPEAVQDQLQPQQGTMTLPDHTGVVYSGIQLQPDLADLPRTREALQRMNSGISNSHKDNQDIFVFPPPERSQREDDPRFFPNDHYRNSNPYNTAPGGGDGHRVNHQDDVPKMIQLPSPPSLRKSTSRSQHNMTLRSSTGSGMEEEKKESNGKLISSAEFDGILHPVQDHHQQQQQHFPDVDPVPRDPHDPVPRDDGLIPKDSDRELRLMRSYSMTESDVGSIDGLPSGVQTTLLKEGEGRARLLQKLDGVSDRSLLQQQKIKQAPPPPLIALPPPQPAPPPPPPQPAQTPHTPPRHLAHLEHRTDSPSSALSQPSCFRSIGLSCLWPDVYGDDLGVEDDVGVEDVKSRSSHGYSNVQRPPNHPVVERRSAYWDEKADEAFELFGHCSAIVNRRRADQVPMTSSLVRVAGDVPPPSYAEAIRANEIDPRLQAWVNSHYTMQMAPPNDGTYDLGRSRTVIVHEIARGDWTWCTAWSPKGDRLAVATENHHLAVIETTASTVWRVRHDRRLKGPAAGDTTHSIRSLAWGKNFIAAGGTGNAVSILSPVEPYDVLHLIKGTGFVGSLDWKDNSNVLAIGSRSKKLMIVRVRSSEDGEQVESEILYQAEFDNWVNRVAFGPTGSFLAAGLATGVLSVFNVREVVIEDEKPQQQQQQELEIKSIGSGTSSRAAALLDVSLVKEFQLDDSVLALDWSPDGRWLYAGGEDYHICVIETTYWEIVHRIPRERWVQCIASSGSGTHVAVGGVSSEISLLDVRNGWDSVMGIELKGLVPLSASWHPKDQALALTGQNNSVLVVETTNARHVKGHHLHSVSPIISVCFSPDGRTAVIGNEAGVVTFFSLSGSTFESTYELVVVLNERLSVDWSSNGLFAVIGSKDSLIIVGPNTRSPSFASTWRKHLSPTNGAGRQLQSITAVFSIQRVIRNIGETHGVAIGPRSRYIAVAGGDRTRVFDATKSFSLVKSWKTGVTLATAWSPDGQWLASIGTGKVLGIYDTSDLRVSKWRSVFSLKCDFNGYALAWAPHTVNGLLYLAYGGSSKIIYIMEMRTLEGTTTWETVLRIPRDGQIRDLDWGTNGLLAAGIDNGTVSIIDLAYLLSGIAVNEKDYNWQRQALTCYTEIRRNRGNNSIQAVRWIPSAPGSDSLIAVGGTDGEMEIVDLTERRRCRGYYAQKSSSSSYHYNNHQQQQQRHRFHQQGGSAANTTCSPPPSPTTATAATTSTPSLKYESEDPNNKPL